MLFRKIEHQCAVGCSQSNEETHPGVPLLCRMQFHTGAGDRSLPDPALNASSAWDDDKAAKARLHGDGGWTAYYEAGQWLQVALDNVTNITAIATQGNSCGDHWTKLYRLESGLDGNDMQRYGKVRGIFRGALPLS